MCTDSKFGFDENSEFIIFNFKKENVRKIEVIFKTIIDRNQIAIGDLQIFYTDSDSANDMQAPQCVAAQVVEEKFEEIDIKVSLKRNIYASIVIFNAKSVNVKFLVGYARIFLLRPRMRSWLLSVCLWPKSFLLLFNSRCISSLCFEIVGKAKSHHSLQENWCKRKQMLQTRYNFLYRGGPIMSANFLTSGFKYECKLDHRR